MGKKKNKSKRRITYVQNRSREARKARVKIRRMKQKLEFLERIVRLLEEYGY